MFKSSKRICMLCLREGACSSRTVTCCRRQRKVLHFSNSAPVAIFLFKHAHLSHHDRVAQTRRASVNETAALMLRRPRLYLQLTPPFFAHIEGFFSGMPYLRSIFAALLKFYIDLHALRRYLDRCRHAHTTEHRLFSVFSMRKT